eukprot:gnl/TRDRNA2_/TRDRNA2_81631_c0_seq2.p1 gnl/TRDRNA2_/TRDRNA2_81631_c0~~gnl/TRDRNA2_/TRDRNA2_81631_c0_seq2.p1  ORF type:complete len:141 (+),score=31.64 gnl/TRDRNA2_/TRDRNA2_81631_c0_seq2:259-681(+)
MWRYSLEQASSQCEYKWQAVKASTLRKAIETTTAAQLVLGVVRSDGSAASYTFTRKPLGFNFARQSPLVVTSLLPNGEAAKLGLEIGATINAINGEPMHSQDFAYQYNLLRECSIRLAQIRISQVLPSVAEESYGAEVLD